MNREETRAAAEVMLHFADGGEVECRDMDNASGWAETARPLWDCYSLVYRKAQPKVSRYRRYVIEAINPGGLVTRRVLLLDEDCVGMVNRTPDECIAEYHDNFVRWIDTEWQEAT